MISQQAWQARLQDIPRLDASAMIRAKARLDDLTKPRGSLGRLEPLLVDLAGMTGHVIPAINSPMTLIFAADHGVVEEGVSRYSPDVTEEMAVNVAMGSAVSSVLARGVGSGLWVVDVGIRRRVRHPRVIVRKVAPGTQNIAQGAAMSSLQLDQALMVGWSTAGEALDQGADLIVVGEIGIANTTVASCMASRLLGLSAERVAGTGTGIDDATFQRKVAIIQTALDRNQTNSDDPLDVLHKLGGFEIAAMTGAIWRSALGGVPILLDGLATAVAALIAVRIAPRTHQYLIPGHGSPEPAHRLLLAELGLEPLVNLDMRLGEATGALMALPLITQAVQAMAETATFSDARVTNPHKTGNDSDSPLESGEPVSLGFSPRERAAVYKVISARRDIRVFLPDPVPRDILVRILNAGHQGPSVGFMQPWNFMIVRDRDMRQRLQTLVDQERVKAGQHYPDARRDYYLRLKVEGLMDAPITLVVTNDPTRGGPHVLGRNTIPETDLMSTACAIENMWLAARAEGVAMGWVSMFRKDDVRKLLKIPVDVDPLALLTVGFTPHFPEIPVLERVGWRERLNLGSLVFEEQWGVPAGFMKGD